MTDDVPKNLPTQVRCFSCGTITQTLRPDEGWMDGASAWYTSGNYGSRLIDGGEHHLEIHLCDVCLLLGRDRVLQYKTTDRDTDRGFDRVYEAWDPPKAGPNPRRRVVVVWEDEQGRYCVANHHGSGGTSWNRHETIREVFESIREHETFMREACTARACRAKILKRVEEDPQERVSPAALAYGLELVHILGDRFPKGEFWHERTDDEGVLVLSITVWTGVRLAVRVMGINSDQRVAFEITDRHAPDVAAHVAATIQDAVEYIATFGRPHESE